MLWVGKVERHEQIAEFSENVIIIESLWLLCGIIQDLYAAIVNINNRKKEDSMIELTRLNDVKFTLNAEVIEFVEETPDTVISLTTGKKIVVKESRQEVTNLVISYKRAIFLQ